LGVIDCPANFPGAHRAPTAETVVKFNLRKSDTLDEIGISILNHNNAFLGWIKKEDVHKLQVDKLHELHGLILSVEPFLWTAGGGQCARGTLLVNHESDCSPCAQSPGQ
jgi:hypothetical protein